MFRKKSDGARRKYTLPGILLRPGVKIFGGIFSILAAVLFGSFRLSGRKKRKMTESEARVASSIILVKLLDVRNQLGDFQAWLRNQDRDVKETQRRYAGLKNLYREWTSHERMEEVLSTVQYDPRIGMNISNGLHELRSLNILLEAILRDELVGTPEGARQFAVVEEHLDRAIGFFNYINKDVKHVPESRQVGTLKEDPE